MQVPNPVARYLLQFALCALVYYFAARLGLSFAVVHDKVSLVWPASGVALAAMVLYGVRLFPAVALAAFAANYGAGLPALSAVAVAFGDTVAALAGTLLLRHLFDFRVTLERTRDVLLLVFPVAFGCSVIAATLGAMALRMGGVLPDVATGSVWVTWWAGDAQGILFIAPLAFAWARGRPVAAELREMLYVALAAALLLGFGSIMSGGLFGPLPVQYLIWYALFPLALWPAIRLGMRETATVNLIVAALTIWAAGHGMSPFASGAATQALVVQHGYLICIALTTLLLGSLNAERRRAVHDARVSEMRFVKLFRSSPQAMALSSLADGRVRDVNDAWCRLFGRIPEQAIGRTTLELGLWQNPADRESMRQRLHQHGRAENFEVVMQGADGTPIEVLFSSERIHIEGQEEMQLSTSVDITERKRAERRLRVSEERFAKVFRSSPSAVVISRVADGRFIEANMAWLALFGYTREEVADKTSNELGVWVYPSVRATLAMTLEQEHSVRDMEVQFCRKSGEIIDALLSAELIEFDGEHCMLSSINDITERTQAERRLRESEKRFADVVEAAGEFVWEVNALWHYTFMSQRSEQVLGYKPEEMLGRRTTDFMPEGEYERVRDWMHANVPRGKSYSNLEHLLLRRDGRTVWLLVSGVPVIGGEGQVLGYRGTALDITERKLAEQRIEQLATRDTLTGLPNRLLLNDRLAQGIVNAERDGHLLAVLFIDLDRFKSINDSLGHPVGDALLREVANCLGGVLRKGDTLSRLGGDEFVIVLQGLKQAEDAGPVAAKVIAALSQPFRLLGHDLNTSGSVGISVYPDDGRDIATLMRNADTAMYHAKEMGRHNYQYFSDEMNLRVTERLQLESGLRRAIAQGEFCMYYQPKVSFSQDLVIGVEALLRWRHPERGLIEPDQFIRVAEETGLIVPIGEWVLGEVCRQAKAWSRLYPLPVALNVSAREFSEGLAERLLAVVREVGLPPELLELEITESVLMRQVETGVRIVQRLRELGVAVTIDDFGVGYSSLHYLRRFDVGTLKIDQSFVNELAVNQDDQAIVRAVIDMAHNLRLNVVAEGVETVEQAEVLRSLRCDGMQGYYFSRPLPAEEFERRYLAPADVV